MDPRAGDAPGAARRRILWILLLLAVVIVLVLLLDNDTSPLVFFRHFLRNLLRALF